MRNYSDIQRAFLDGTEEIYEVLFTDRLKFSLLNEEETKYNVYGETVNKVYHDPVQLVGRVQTTFDQGENPIEGIQVDAVITIPTKQLMRNDLSHEQEEDLETLRKGKFAYGGFEYLIHEVKPRTFIADKWHTFAFVCSVDKKTSLER